jgi:nucleoid-associated protein YgaU
VAVRPVQACGADAVTDQDVQDSRPGSLPVRAAITAGQPKPYVRCFRAVAVSVKRLCGFVAVAAFTGLVYSAKRRGEWDRQWRDVAWSHANGSEGSIIVAPGDSFWSLAEQVVRNHLGRAPDDDEVLEPWLAMIDINRDRLLDPENPDLIHPGLVLRLPPPDCLPARLPSEDRADGEAS